MTGPAVSVVIPCRNEEDTLLACLEAIEAQDLPREQFEVLLVDGHSTDGSAELGLLFGHRVLRDAGTGPAGARNVGIRAARAPLIAFTDADCVARQDWLSTIVQIFEEEPGLAGIGGALRMSRRSILGHMEDLDAVARYRGFITSNAAYRREALLAVGGFAEDLICCEDYDLAWRLQDAGYRVRHDPRPVVRHDPPEVVGSVPRYLRKQAWYAQHDVPAHLRGLLRLRSRPGAPGSAQAARSLVHSLSESALVVALGAGLALRRPALVGLALGTALATTAYGQRRVVPYVEDRHILVPMLLLGACKGLARGAGTLAGVASVARPGALKALRRAADAGLPALPSAAAGPASA